MEDQSVLLTDQGVYIYIRTHTIYKGQFIFDNITSIYKADIEVLNKLKEIQLDDIQQNF